MDGSDNGNADFDTDIAMHEMMGFSNFTGTKRNAETREAYRGKQSSAHVSGANAQPVAQKPLASNTNAIPTEQAAPQSATHFVPASLPPRPGTPPYQLATGTTTGSGLDPSDQTNSHSRNAPFTMPPSRYVSTASTSFGHDYTHPSTGYTLTADELTEYASGKSEQLINPVTGIEEEVMVYFQPNFVEDDPWSKVTNHTTSNVNAGSGVGRSSNTGWRGNSEHNRRRQQGQQRRGRW